MQGYLYFWRDEGERAPLGSEQAAALFGNVDDIYRFNSQFLTQLQSCGLDPVEVARCFVRNNSGFTIYTDYCTNYPRWASSAKQKEIKTKTYHDPSISLPS